MTMTQPNTGAPSLAERIFTQAADLSERSILASFKTECWPANIRDAVITAEVAHRHNLDGKAGHYLKQLMPPNCEIHSLRAAISAARKFFYANTLPWERGNACILPTKNWDAFSEGMFKLKHRCEEANKALLEHYDERKYWMRMHRAETYREHEYPTPEQLEAEFKWSLSFRPVITSGDFRCDLPRDVLQEAMRELDDWQMQQLKEAMVVPFQRLYEATKVLAQELLKGPKLLQASFDVLATLCDTQDRLNLANDPALTEMTDKLRKEVLAYSAAELRQLPITRDEVGHNVEKICDQMRDLMV